MARPAHLTPVPGDGTLEGIRLTGDRIVVASPDVRLVREGDRVLFLPQAGLELDVDGEEYLLLRERDIQAVSSRSEQETVPGQYL